MFTWKTALCVLAIAFGVHVCAEKRGDAQAPEPSLEPSLQAPQLPSSAAEAILGIFTAPLDSLALWRLAAAKDVPHLGLRLAYKPDAKRAWGARHITVANFNTTGYATPQAALADAKKALAACVLAWHLPASAKLQAWNLYASQGWGTPDTKTYVITASDKALDKYAECVKKASPRRIYDVKGPNETPGTPWHVGLYGLEAKGDVNSANADLIKYKTNAFVWRPYLVYGSSEAGQYGGRQGCPGSNFEWSPVLFPKNG